MDRLIELRMQLALAQDAEHYARDRRLAVEAEILALMPVKHEGTVTDKEVGLSVSYKVTRKLDYEVYKSIADGLPVGLQCVDMKPTQCHTRSRASWTMRCTSLLRTDCRWGCSAWI